MGAIKYNIGDKVLIKDIDWYNENKNKHGEILVAYKLFSHGVYTWEHARFTKNMSKYCGQTLTISEYSNMGYKMQECIDSGEDFDIWTDEMIEKRVEEKTKPKDMGEVSDGYHTFNELYEYRLLYNAALFNEFAKQGLYDVHKSRKHSDGEYPFGDSNWFIVMAELPTGQISNHYEMKDWDKFQIPEKPLANKWDEHSPKDVAERLTSFTTKKAYPKTYDECCEVLGIGSYFEPEIRNATTEECHKFTKLMRLKRCRDAYWKLYGEEMGLGKPWESDWREKRYIIYLNQDDIIDGYREAGCAEHHIFEFPTPEMRNTFKENFDPDIEICKEFL